MTAETKYYAKTIEHARAIDQLWPTDADSARALAADKDWPVKDCQRLPTREFYQPCLDVARMFNYKANAISAKRFPPGALNLPKRDADLAGRWAMNLATLDPTQKEGVDRLIGILKPFSLNAPSGPGALICNHPPRCRPH